MLLTPVHWQGCYREGWQDLICPDAFSHPAKYARGLIHRIYRHLLEHGYVRQGETVLDPFGGVALGALDAMTYGLHYVGVELESRFVDLGRKNLELWRQRYGFTGGTLVQGDSRNLRSVLAGVQAQCVVGSPPFSACISGGAGVADRADWFRARTTDGGKIGQSCNGDYGTTPGQLGAMPPGQVGCVVGSPPYAAALNGSTNQDLGDRKHVQERWRNPDSPGQGYPRHYGQTPGQLGAMPPGRLACVSSPPWENCVASMQASSGFDFAVMAENRTKKHGRSGNPGDLATQAHLDGQRLMGRNYGTSPAQLGNTAGDTFWTASAQIMTELAVLLPPGAVCAWVVKAYVKDKQIVPFPDQWRALCEAHGFRLVEEIHASLVEHYGMQEDFFEGAQRVQTERKSFFRRLAERKGSPRIDHETVLILTRL